ncbi:hypothetical protein [Robinsoniella peoriensis]|uniref:hypothetical protein n=1 Tax=Robinsoniella peoriensis TaxID=180332 RepID=UPI003626F8B4
MCKTAYDEAYFDSMIQKTRYLFKLIGRNTKNPFQVIEDYMKSCYRRNMDQGNPLYLNKTPKQILETLGIKIKVEFEISEEFDESVLVWMADIYTYIQWKYSIPSERIADKIMPQKLYEKYSPLHEASLENSADKLVKIYQLNEKIR